MLQTVVMVSTVRTQWNTAVATMTDGGKDAALLAFRLAVLAAYTGLLVGACLALAPLLRGTP